MKIIDCFIFYNELDLLTYRFNILNNFVDYFVIVESTHTFTGKEKRLYFNENIHLFEHLQHKIIHIIVEDFPFKYPNIHFNNREQWQNEYFQRNAISRGIDSISNLNPNDIIIISDVDEIPDPNILDRIKKGYITITIQKLIMDFYYYNLNTKIMEEWHAPKVISYQKYRELNLSCDNIRNYHNVSKIQNGGWHLSYFGDANFIQNKLNNFSHQEFNNQQYTDLSKIEERVQNSRDLFGRNWLNPVRINITDNTYLPPDYQTYLSKYYTLSGGN
jgi:beta-1,4-mannosyl-glycoprotein beta-1,4-N-acetylglucosaminyltransferase